MKQKFAIILFFTVLSFGVKASNDSTVYWKRYASVDLISFGSAFNTSKLTHTKLYSNGFFSAHFGLFKKQNTPFLNMGLDGAFS